MKSIIITSIFYPTNAVKKFAELKNYKLIVVGDKKTPEDWNNKNTIFLSVDDQKKLTFKIIKKLPFNHYCRKMIGYLYAITNGAENIIETDDDNIPNNNWGFPAFDDKYYTIQQDKGFVNIYKYFTEKDIWPRGFPLQYINNKSSNPNILKNEPNDINVGIWQSLANNDPDVDAIYRLLHNEACYFEKKSPIVLGKNTICPFNTQNTSFRKELFPLLYLPSFVNFRFTDILRGLIAQPIMWLYNYHLGFTSATVTQKRNPHNYLEDFESEIPCYLYSEKIIEIVLKNIKASNSINDNLIIAYESLLRNGIVKKEEIEMLKAWIEDIKGII